MKTLSSWLCLAALALAGGSATAAVPGELDPTYGGAGIVRSGYGELAQADDLAVDKDGNVYAAGTSTSAGVTVPLLAKYKPDGSLDFGFGSGGFVTPVSPPAGVAAYSALTLYRDTLYQMITAGDKLYVYAFNTSGVPQAWFGTGGVASFTVGSGIYPVFDIAQWGNYLGMAASARNPATGNYDFVVVELTLGGAPVAGFGVGGIAYSRQWIAAASRNRLTGIAFQPDGRIVAAGRTNKPGEAYDFVVARYRYDGTPDPTFGLGGFRLIDFGGDDFGRRVALRRDGRIVTAGSVCRTLDPATGEQYCLAAAAGLKADGNLDPGFGVGGRFSHDPGEKGAIVTDMILDERERPILVGQHVFDTPYTKAFVARLRSTGVIDGTYLGGGWADFSYGWESSANGGVKLYPGSRIATAGNTMKLVTPPSTFHGLMTTARHVN